MSRAWYWNPKLWNYATHTIVKPFVQEQYGGRWVTFKAALHPDSNGNLTVMGTEAWVLAGTQPQPSPGPGPAPQPTPIPNIPPPPVPSPDQVIPDTGQPADQGGGGDVTPDQGNGASDAGAQGGQYQGGSDQSGGAGDDASTNGIYGMPLFW